MSIVKEKNLNFPEYRPAPVLNGCGQGCIQMITHYFEKRDLSVSELNEICGVKSKAAFSGVHDMVMGMIERGYDVIRIGDIKPEDYYEDPAKYMKVVGFDPKDYPEIVQARRDTVSNYMSLRDQGKFEDRSMAPTVDDFEALISQGYVLVSWVNCEGIRGNFNKTTGHYVVPIDVDSKKIIYHDPGYFSEIYGHSYAVAVSATHDLFLKCMRYPESVGVNPETNLPPMAGLLAFKR